MRKYVLAVTFKLLVLTSNLSRQAMLSKRHPCHNTSRSERLWFVWLWSLGISVRNIAKRARRSPTTVKRWVKRLRTQQFMPYGAPRVLLPPSPAEKALHAPFDARFYRMCRDKYIHDMLGFAYQWNLYVHYVKYKQTHL